MKKLIYILAAAVLLVVGGYLGVKQTQTMFGNSVGGGDLADACNIGSVTPVLIGNQASTNLVATTSRRAWAMLQQPNNATNTVSLNFNSGAAAVTTSGLYLNSTTTSIIFGLNTPLPYTGVVTAITSTGSTTLLLTTCNY